MSAVDLGAIKASTAQDLLVHRPRYEVHARVLPLGAIAFLDMLAVGQSFAAAFAEATRAQPQAEPAALFSLLLQEGLVTELFHLDTDTP